MVQNTQHYATENTFKLCLFLLQIEPGHRLIAPSLNARSATHNIIQIVMYTKGILQASGFQRLHCDTKYLCISKHGVWADRSIALDQEEAILSFHCSWSSFADWTNRRIKTGCNLTFQQSQHLFIEHFSWHLLVAHGMHDTCSCHANLKTDVLVWAVREEIGRDDGIVPGAMEHACMECTHQKR